MTSLAFSSMTIDYSYIIIHNYTPDVHHNYVIIPLKNAKMTLASGEVYIVLFTSNYP